MTRLWCSIRGDVQGVGFRWFARETARGLGLNGWARNRRDGSVEIEAQGPAQAIKHFASAMRAGPPGARVSEFESKEVPAQDAETTFVILESQ